MSSNVFIFCRCPRAPALPLVPAKILTADISQMCLTCRCQERSSRGCHPQRCILGDWARQHGAAGPLRPGSKGHRSCKGNIAPLATPCVPLSCQTSRDFHDYISYCIFGLECSGLCKFYQCVVRMKLFDTAAKPWVACSCTQDVHHIQHVSASQLAFLRLRVDKHEILKSAAMTTLRMLFMHS